LAEMKNDEQLKLIPVCILSTSAAQNDIRDAYRLGANCYAAKQLDIIEFIAQMRAIYDFWFDTVRLPGE
jgi:two-component system, chemotaxis family, response regulator Rcp1